MSKNDGLFSTYPSRVYVFVVISLATFLVCFAGGRQPGIHSRVAVSLAADSLKGREFSSEQREHLTTQAGDQCHDSEFILAALRSAGVDVESHPESAMARVRDISRRLRVCFRDLNETDRGIEISLATTNPEAGVKVLNSMAAEINDRSNQDLHPSPAAVVAQRGGSISAFRLLGIGLLSSMAGLTAVWFSRGPRPTTILRSAREVKEVVDLPVLSLHEQTLDGNAVAKTRRRRWTKVGIVAAELGIAAVFLLILFNVFATQAFSSRLLQDPLAAYGEALTRLIG